ncbi:MAG: hypothetical protein ACI4ED_05675 [Suilimivivens sp.]
MEKRILAIFDGEESYAYRLMDFISAKEDIPFEIHVFTKGDKFFPYAEKEEIECLLISENAYQKEIEKLKIPHIIILSENGSNLNKALCHINKYQSSENVLREVMEYYTEKAQDTGTVLRTGNKKMRIIGIYTPVGRCLQTTFSLTLGQMLARRYKTLYLNFEAYSGLGRMLNREFKSDISDLAYYFSCAREKLFYRMESMMETINGMDFIPPADVYQSLSGIRGAGWVDLFREIEKVSEYEFLLLDLSDCLLDLWEVLQNCDHIYTIVREDPLAAAKIEQYEKALESMKYGDITSRTKKWKLPVFKQLPLHFGELTYGELAGYIKREVFPDLFREDKNNIR